MRVGGDVGLDGGEAGSVVRTAGVGVVLDAHDACVWQCRSYAQAGTAGAAKGDDHEALMSRGSHDLIWGGQAQEEGAFSLRDVPSWCII